MRDSVVDSFALIAFLRGEKGADAVTALLESAARAGVRVRITSVNWAEVRYLIERRMGAPAWRAARDKLVALPIEVVPVGLDLAESAAGFKATRRMALADCFAAALAREREADLYTGDPEFREVEREIRVVWI